MSSSQSFTAAAPVRITQSTRGAVIGLPVGTGLAIVAALGPLVSAITITVGVETQVGDASSLPDARMLPAALEGVGAVALIFLFTRRPAGRLRAWCVALIFVSLGAGMAAQGAHAIWYDQRLHDLELPWRARLLASFVPPVSGLATLHLVVKMVEDLIGTIQRLAMASPADISPAAAPDGGQPTGLADQHDLAGDDRPTTLPAGTTHEDGEKVDQSLRGSSQPDTEARSRPARKGRTALDAKVLRILRANPHANWKVVRDGTGLSDANAKRALTAARKTLRSAPAEPGEERPLDASPVHPNGRSH